MTNTTAATDAYAKYLARLAEIDTHKPCGEKLDDNVIPGHRYCRTCKTIAE